MTIAVTFSPDESRASVTNPKQSVTSQGVPSWEQTTRPNFYRPVVPAWDYYTPNRIRYVSTLGDDSANGIWPEPWKTIARALAWATVPGDIVYILAGEYQEAIPNITASGTEFNPIVLSCARKEMGGGVGSAKISRPPADVVAKPWRSCITLAGVQHVIINGLELQGALGMSEVPAGESLNQCGILLSNGAGLGCKLTNNVIHSNLHCGIKEAGHGGRGFLSSGNIVLSNGRNTVDHGIYIPSPDSSGTVIDGDIYLDNFGAGVHSYHPQGGANGLVVRRVLAVGNRTNLLQSGADGIWEFNTCSGGYAGLMNFNAGATRNVYRRSIFAHFSAYEQVNSGTVGVNVENENCNWGGGAGMDGVQPGPLSIRADPKFRDQLTGDFRLSADSPCPTWGCFAPGDNMSTGSRTYSVTILEPPLIITPATLPPTLTVGVAFSQQMGASGGVPPYSYAATGTLPPGLTLSPGGVLAGTPTAAGSFTFTVTAVGG